MKIKKPPNMKSAFTLAMLIFFFAAPFGCSKQDTNPPIDPPVEEVNSYFVSLPAWNVFSQQKPDEIKKGVPKNEFDCENKAILSTSQCSITRTPEEIVTYDPGSEILYLGSLIQGGGLKGDTIKSLPIYQRAPLSVSISLQMSNNSRVVQNPNLTTVNGAIGEMIEAAQNAGHVSGSNILFEQKSCYSVEQSALELGLSAKFMKYSAKASLSYQGTNKTHTLTAFFKQIMFTTRIENFQRPSDLFSSEFTKELLDEQITLGRIGHNNLPVYVSNIVWGRMMTLTMTSEYDEKDMEAALDASYKNLQGNISAAHKEILENSSIKLVTIGGDAQAALNFLQTGNLGDFFKEDAPLTTAVPISYTLRNLGDNNIAKVSEIAEYNIAQRETVTFEVVNNEAEWRDKLQQKGSVIGTWETNRTNLNMANESSIFRTVTDNQLYMRSIITFPGNNTGFPFDFNLKNMGATGNPDNALVQNDNECKWPFNTISIGDIDDLENDDFEINVTGNKVYGLAFNLYGSTATSDEGLDIYAYNGTSQGCYIGQEKLPSMEEGFIGVISPVPISRIFFSEDEGGDDIGILNFYFGYKTN